MNRSFHRGSRGLAWLALAVVVAVGLVVWTSQSGRARPVAASAPEAVAPVMTAQPAAPAVAAVPEPVVAARPAEKARMVLATPTPRATPSEARTAPMTAGRIVGIDPETGQLGAPTPEQLQALTQQRDNVSSTTSEGLVETHLPNGTVILNVEGYMQDYTVASIGRSGKPVLRCVQDPQGTLKKNPRPIQAPVLEEE